MVKKGFSLLELVVAIFLITIVIGTGLLIIAANLNVMQKANEILLASAIARYYVESVKTIDFPPIFADRQSDFPKKIGENAPLGTAYEVPSIDPSFRIYMGCVWYGPDGSEITSDTDIDRVALRKIKIEVRRKKDNYPLFIMPIFIVRNGIY
ncbi:MAG: prepilin-type N-terminal cleavage/methylation domain-containing protein [bacterium]|nr:prepilin-type N-terminal cleavage/methylation domain-containing protein [bacterium]